MSATIEKLMNSSDPLEQDLAQVLLHWQEQKRKQGLPASLGYEPKDINEHGAVAVISSRVLKQSSGFEQVDKHLSYESLVLKHQTYFLEDIIEAAKQRLKASDHFLKFYERQEIKFFIKLGLKELGGIPLKPGNCDEWIGCKINLPKTLKTHESTETYLQNGVSVFIWVHENDGGSGLTAVVNLDEIILDENRTAVISDIEIFEASLGKVFLLSHIDENEFVKTIHDYRHSRIWPISDTNVSYLFKQIHDKSTEIAETNSIYNGFTDPKNARLNNQAERKTTLREVVLRANQAHFRAALLNSRGCKCAITGTTEPKALEAAHIIPYSLEKDGRDLLVNGLLLRRDIHKLFDDYLLSINPETRAIEVSPEITDSSYRKLNGIIIHDPIGNENLKFHYQNFKAAL